MPDEEAIARNARQVTRPDTTVDIHGVDRMSAHYERSLYTHGVSEIMTADTDFRKFPFLTVTNPFRPAR